MYAQLCLYLSALQCTLYNLSLIGSFVESSISQIWTWLFSNHITNCKIYINHNYTIIYIVPLLTTRLILLFIKDGYGLASLLRLKFTNLLILFLIKKIQLSTNTIMNFAANT